MSRTLLPNNLSGDNKVNVQELYSKKKRGVSETQVFAGSYFGLLPPASTFGMRNHSLQPKVSHFRKKSNLIKDAMLHKHGLNYPSRRFLLPQRKNDPNRTLPTKPSVANLQLDPNADLSGSGVLRPRKKGSLHNTKLPPTLDHLPIPKAIGALCPRRDVTPERKMPLKSIQI